MQQDTGRLKRRGLLGTLLGTAAGLGLLGTAGVQNAEAMERLLQDEVDRYQAELNRQVGDAFLLSSTNATGPDPEGWLRTMLGARPPGWRAEVANYYIQFFRYLMDGRSPLLREYMNWLGPIPAFYEADLAVAFGGYREDQGAYVPAVDLASWSPDRLRNATLQRNFVTWKLYGLQ